MAKYIIPPPGKEVVLVKCMRCNTMYAPDLKVHPFGDMEYYEACPTCGYSRNQFESTISLGRYNLIRFWRGLFRHEQSDAGSTDH